MNRFILWKRNALPDTATVSGRAFSIRTDHKTILKTLAILGDPEVIDGHKAQLVARAFFVDDVPTGTWADAYGDFVRCGEEPRQSDDEKVFDYDFDAPEIYASFLMLYGIDLIEKSLHWWRFTALLNGAMRLECPITEKIRIRTLDVSKCEDKFKAQQAKDAVALPNNTSVDEMILVNKISERLLKGLPVNDLIRR